MRICSFRRSEVGYRAASADVADRSTEKHRLDEPPASPKEKLSKHLKPETLEQSGERLNKLLVQLHRDRVKSLGAKNSGLHDQYMSLLDAGQIVRPGDLEVARVVLNQLPAFENYVVLKAGVGAVPLLLAMAGMNCTAFEASGHRVAAIQAATEALSRNRKEAAARVSVEIGLAPDAVQKPSTLGIAVGYVSRAAEQEQDRVLELLSRFDALLVEPRTFIRHRSQADLAGVFRRVGWHWFHPCDRGGRPSDLRLESGQWIAPRREGGVTDRRLPSFRRPCGRDQSVRL